MNRADVVNHIESTLTEVLERPVDGLSEETRLFDDLHLDSTSILEVLMALEDAVGVEVDPEQLEMSDFASVGSLTSYLLRHAPAVVTAD